MALCVADVFDCEHVVVQHSFAILYFVEIVLADADADFLHWKLHSHQAGDHALVWSYWVGQDVVDD